MPTNTLAAEHGWEAQTFRHILLQHWCAMQLANGVCFWQALHSLSQLLIGHHKLANLDLRVGDGPARHASIASTLQSSVRDVLAPALGIPRLNILHAATLQQC